MFELFGESVNKSAMDVRNETCDWLLDSENTECCRILCESVKPLNFSYSTWITNLANQNSPCDTLGLYLLCRTYKHHVVVLTLSQCWCSFKPGNRTLFDKLVKADLVLLWLGENRFAEIKPLKKITSSPGPLLEWQTLTDSIQHVHKKCLKDKRTHKPRKTTQLLPLLVLVLLAQTTNIRVKLTLITKTCITTGYAMLKVRNKPKSCPVQVVPQIVDCCHNK